MQSTKPAPSPTEEYLLRYLREAPRRFGFKYEEIAEDSLLEALFTSLAGGNRDYLHLFFPRGGRHYNWKLQKAQGAENGKEYTPGARGKACGHIYRPGEVTYGCRTCGIDDSCTLCFRCFESSDHAGHQVIFNTSSGSNGCCDCGDSEAWKCPVYCSIHTHIKDGDEMDSEKAKAEVPQELAESIRTTISIVFDYLCDVLSCSQEYFRQTKTVQSVQRNEEMSRLTSRYLFDPSEDNTGDPPEYALILWSDEKHTRDAIKEQVARACKVAKRFALEKTLEADRRGRSVLRTSSDLNELLSIAKIIEQIKLTITVRSTRDTFREEMVATIIEWLMDIAGCTVGEDAHILTRTICLEMLGVWNPGSKAGNVEIGKEGFEDESFEDDTERERLTIQALLIRQRQALPPNNIQVADQIAGDDDEDEVEGNLGDEHEEEEVSDDDEVIVEAGTVNLITYTNSPGEETVTSPEAMGSERAATPVTTRTMRDATPPSTTQEARTSYVSNSITEIGLPPIPKNPMRRPTRPSKSAAPFYWLERPQGWWVDGSIPPHADIRQRIRLDWLILYDLRLWKKSRTELRDLYIHTVVSIPEFKKVIGLRFAALYTILSQLYLIADREPERSIIHMSFQMLTTPTIVAEVVERANFITVLMAIIYTFLTTRQVGYPEDVDKDAPLTLDTGTVTSRRLWSLFQDMKHLCSVDYVKQCLRTDDRYMLQFLDIVRLHHGLYPNTRATIEHVEFESETWFGASFITREINKLSMQIGSAFYQPGGEVTTSLQNAIMHSVHTAITTAVKMPEPREWRSMTFEFQKDSFRNYEQVTVMQYDVAKQPVSFHHAVHYTLSWLVEMGREMPRETLRTLMEEAATVDISPDSEETKGDRIISFFEYPLRIQVWMAQIKTNLWVRNGASLNHQMRTYRGVFNRDFTLNRDILLLQLALVINEPIRILATIIDRFGLYQWVHGDFSIPEGWDEPQLLEMAEEFIRLLIVLLSERLNLIPESEEPNLEDLKIKREIAHVLCFKPTTFSDLTQRLPERLPDSPKLQKLLHEVAKFKMPEGLSDSGTFELKPEYQDTIDPYYIHFNRNQREECETTRRARVAKQTGQKPDEVVLQPYLHPIKSGVFEHLAAITGTKMFAQIIFYFLAFAASPRPEGSAVASRVEPFLHMVLHLCHVAVKEDNTDANDKQSFIQFALEIKGKNFGTGQDTVGTLLKHFANGDQFHSCQPQAKYILQKMKEKKPDAFATLSGFSWDIEQPISPTLSDEAEKKRLAKEKAAKIMAQFQRDQQNFLNSAGLDFDDEYMSDDESWDTSTFEQKTTWKYPAGTCILCQEEMNDQKLYGTLALIKNSNIFRTTPLRDAEFAKEVVSTPASLDRSAEHLRPIGVAKPGVVKVTRCTRDLRLEDYERQTLGRGFPSTELTTGAVAVSCNHNMHYSCFEQYHEATKRRHHQQNSRHHPERIETKEFVCPLCKALGNTFIPIIWKPKVASSITPSVPFSTWLASIARSGKNVDSQQTPRQGEDAAPALQEVSSAMNPTLQQRVGAIQSRNYELDQVHGRDSLIPQMPPHVQIQYLSRTANLTRLETTSFTPEVELYKVYRQLRETLHINGISSRYVYKDSYSDLSQCDSLAEVLGYTIAAIEIGQRGAQCDVNETLLNRIPEQTLSLLRILSETVMSYICIGSLQRKEENITTLQFDKFKAMLKTQLFTFEYDDPTLGTVEPLLSQDIFVFLASCSVCLVPSMKVDFHHILTLCYIAQIVKCVVCLQNADGMHTRENWTEAVEESDLNQYSDSELSTFVQFWNTLAIAPNQKFTHGSSRRTVAALRFILSKYALVFLRKSLILLHVRFGFEPSVINFDLETPELWRLSSLLGVPAIDDVFATTFSETTEGQGYRAFIMGWQHHLSIEPRNLKLQHPAIFELIGLPQEYGVLVEEAMRRKCPAMPNKDLTDPTLCLFCGEFLCAQATCCAKKDQDGRVRGACDRHMNRCGGNVGLFLMIKKCTVLFMHGGAPSPLTSGSFTVAPYIDMYGECDQSLKRNRQLFLMKKRYDILLRNVWLNHGIPSVIARRLEAEVNNGGWETL